MSNSTEQNIIELWKKKDIDGLIQALKNED